MSHGSITWWLKDDFKATTGQVEEENNRIKGQLRNIVWWLHYDYMATTGQVQDYRLTTKQNTGQLQYNYKIIMGQKDEDYRSSTGWLKKY